MLLQEGHQPGVSALPDASLVRRSVWQDAWRGLHPPVHNVRICDAASDFCRFMTLFPVFPVRPCHPGFCPPCPVPGKERQCPCGQSR